jgi:hypothetical protein
VGAYTQGEDKGKDLRAVERTDWLTQREFVTVSPRSLTDQIIKARFFADESSYRGSDACLIFAAARLELMLSGRL